MAVGAVTLLALVCGAVFVGAAPPKGEAKRAGDEEGETPLEHMEELEGTRVSMRD